MCEECINKLMKRIDDSVGEGIATAHIRDDYYPIGQSMINNLTRSGDYVKRKVLVHNDYSIWKIYKKGFEPYLKIRRTS